MKLQHQIHVSDDINLGDRMVAMSNALVRSAHAMSLSTKRLITTCIAKTERDDEGKIRLPKGFNATAIAEHRDNWGDWHKMDNGEFTVYLSASDYAKVWGISESTAYTQLQEAANSVGEHVIRMPTRSPKGSPGVRIFSWAHMVEYFPGEGYVKLTWHCDFAAHIYNLGIERTQYLLNQATLFTSVYPWRLFELLRCHTDPSRPYSPDIDVFAAAMDAPPAYRSDFAAIRRRILEKAIEELKEKYGYKIAYETRTAGRKVIGLKFIYDPEELRPAQRAFEM